MFKERVIEGNKTFNLKRPEDVKEKTEIHLQNPEWQQHYFMLFQKTSNQGGRFFPALLDLKYINT